MTLNEIAAGQRQRWTLLEKIGEGDAGEVYTAASLLDRRPAILKRPVKNGFSGDMQRQAAQIHAEGRLLAALAGVSPNQAGDTVKVPRLIDQGHPGTEYGDKFFIVIEKAAGFNLNDIARISRFGIGADQKNAQGGDAERQFLERIARQGKIPSLLLLRVLSGLVRFLDHIHYYEAADGSGQTGGVIWNDIKPEHLYFEPGQGVLTLIDWGNGQFLESDGTAKDRLASRGDDYDQFITSMGQFLQEFNPELHAKLDWPPLQPSGQVSQEELEELKRTINREKEKAFEELRVARRQEADLAGLTEPDRSALRALEVARDRIYDFGELPDEKKALRVHTNLAKKLASDRKLDEFLLVCRSAGAIPGIESAQWDLLVDIAGLIERSELDQVSGFNALAAGVTEDWPAVLWEMLEGIQDEALPDWWDDISLRIRERFLGLGTDANPPYVGVSRLFYTLQASMFRMITNRSPIEAANEYRPGLETRVKILEEEIVKMWKEAEPDPPNSGIGYQDIDRILEEIEDYMPGTKESLEAVLNQPRAQADIVLGAWQHREFETARHGLRGILTWDPHRRRLLLADRTIAAAPRWLVKVRKGARADEHFQDYLTNIELEGRDLRNQVGPAEWLDLILDAFKQLRNGARPADLMLEHPQILTDIPWLAEHRSREILSLPRTRPLTIEREKGGVQAPASFLGGEEGVLGESGDLTLAEPLDGWVPEARGSSARVFLGFIRSRHGRPDGFAVKVMRPDRLEYASPLFREEAQILSLLRDVPAVNALAELGFIRLDAGCELPAEGRRSPAHQVDGKVLRYSPDEVQSFLVTFDSRIEQGWLPYLALEKLDPASNLMVYCDAGYTHGSFLPLKESLLLAIQILDVLQIAHDRNIVYRDHKILHYYWDVPAHAVSVIDWNIAKRHPQGLSSAERRFDLVQFGARALHHILTGRSAPGALPLGPNRPEEIEQASHHYSVQWTYDDERLPNSVKALLERALSEGFETARELRKELDQIYQQIPDPSPISR